MCSDIVDVGQMSSCIWFFQAKNVAGIWQLQNQCCLSRSEFFYSFNMNSFFILLYIFYARQHICYSAYMLSPVRPSNCLSVRWVDHRKTVEVKIVKFSPYGSPIPLVFAG